MIEIAHNQRMLTNDAHVRVNVKVCLLISVICEDCITSHGPDDGGKISFTKNYLPFQCKVLLLVVGVAVPCASGDDFMSATIVDTYFTS